ncbi:MAG TPA: hypothetical protein VJ723_11940 [Candidatus Angelobacter sp.]|nr:hypothetical protein [Candidatus Angelobacter sp.]
MAAPGFANDIKPLFTQVDRDHMHHLGMFDLFVYEEVKTNAEEILASVKSGRMPPPNENRQWTPDKVQKFQDWINGGFQS